MNKSQFDNIWVADFEFVSTSGNNPDPVVCMAAENLVSGEIKTVWLEGEVSPPSPFSFSERDLYVAFYASAEMGCHLALNWEMPPNILDLYVECRNLFNGHPTLHTTRSLINVASALRVSGTTTSAYKEDMRDRIQQGSPYTPVEKKKILEYCYSDVAITKDLYRKLQSNLDIPRALLRGKYMAAVAMMERNGVPLDTKSFTQLKRGMDTGSLQKNITREANRQFDVYDGVVFKLEKFEKYLRRVNMPWPRTATGRLSLDHDTFKEQTRIFPEIQFLKDARYTLGKLRLKKIPVGIDGRTRTLISPFSAKTGRNQPSSNQFIFSPAVWLRGLIKPEKGTGIAYIDYDQQEIAIAAALSKDSNLTHSYKSGDPYLTFGKAAGLIPEDATKKSHYNEREKFKICFLASQYGMKENTFARYGNIPIPQARGLLRNHKKLYEEYWAWSDNVFNMANITGKIQTCFGWTMLTKYQKESSIRNFPMQAHGSEILRLACCLILEAGIKVCAPVHDAILIESPLETLEETVKETQSLMSRAGEIVLEGFNVTTSAEIIKYPDRYQDPRGIDMWDKIGEYLGGWESDD